MLGHRIFAAAAVVLGLALTTNTAQAAPQLLLPDVNFVTHGNDFVMTGDSTIFTLSVDTSTGDFMTIDRGDGFTPITGGSLVATGNGELILSIGGEQTMHAVVDQVSLQNSLVGKTLFALYKVDASSIDGYFAGQTIVLDGLVYNIDANNAGQIKGDVAPVVPEPATLSLVLLGLSGFAGAARRKLS
ncbi:MAG: PEP-CTERM sorting domain-containing protein [Planctomycetota bacterium]